MAPLDDLPIPPVGSTARVGSVLRSQRVGAIQLPPGVVPPAGQRLLEEWRRRRDRREGGGEEAAMDGEVGDGSAPPPEVDPPETYGEHAEVLHRHDGTEAPAPRLDLEA